MTARVNFKSHGGSNANVVYDKSYKSDCLFNLKGIFNLESKSPLYTGKTAFDSS